MFIHRFYPVRLLLVLPLALLCASASQAAHKAVTSMSCAGHRLAVPGGVGQGKRRTRTRPAPPVPADGCANQQSPLVRVCLLRYEGAGQISVAAPAGAKLLNDMGRERAAGIGPWTFSAGGAGIQVRDAQGRKLGAIVEGQPWRVQMEDGAGQLGLRGSGSAVRHYHGSLEIRNAGGQIRLINEVDMDSYLCGVVISEIGDGPLEAIKAQAIAARTYAISSRGRWRTDGYDLRDTVDSQAYNGIEAETPDGNRAVRETSGWILTQNGQAIDADFCDDCGGVTAPGDDPNVLPRSVSDAEAHRNIRHSPHGVWTLLLPPDKLSAMVGRNSKARGTGTLLGADISARDVSGRAQRVRLAWGPKPTPLTPPNLSNYSPTPSANASPPSPSETADNKTGFQPPLTSSALPPVPTMFTEISGESLRGLIGYNVLRSTLFTIRRLPNGNFQFDGRGWGHGHGLCQQGALALAAAPLNRSAAAILQHYYPGALLTRMSQAEEAGGEEEEKRRKEKKEIGRNN